MSIRFACCLVALVYGVGGVTSVRAETASAWRHFSDEPDGALIRRMESPAESFATTRAAEAPEGLVVRRQHRWLPELRALAIDSELVNTGATAAAVGDVRIADWRIRVADDQDAARYRSLTHRNDVWYGSSYWTGPDWTRVGKDWHHSGNNTPSVRRFRAPRDGRVAISGRVYKADTNKGGGDGVRLSIRHGNDTVWKTEIDGNDAKGVEPDLTLDVRKGDSIRFVVHKRGHIAYDTTHWDPVVTYADGERFQASVGFSTSEQGQGGWFYEMEVDPDDKTSLPCVRGFDLDVAPRAQTPTPSNAIRLTHRNALPLFVVADGADRSGVAMVLAQDSAWQLDAAFSVDGSLNVTLLLGEGGGACRLAPGESMPLPRLVVGAYRGAWVNSVTMLGRLLSSDVDVGGVRGKVAMALRRTVAPFGESPEATRLPELDLWVMVQDDWRQQDKLTDTEDSYATAASRHLERALGLVGNLREGRTDEFLAAEVHQLASLAAMAARRGLDLEARRSLYRRARWLKRRIALSNPLLDFGPMLFCKRVPTSYSHLVMQYFGWRARPGGSLFVLEKPGRSLAVRDILDGRLADGNILEPRLSYDGKRVIFSYVKCLDKQRDPSRLANDTDEGFYHIYEVNVDGTGLRQLTRGPYDDLMPTYLPDGGIAFCSTRRRGYARCFGGQFSPRWHVYTLHRMNGDGTDIRTISFHDTNEWFPTVSQTGLVLYSRWDYIDRDAVTHQNLWATRPDGTNPIALWGNATSSPHCTFQMQPIPGTSKIVFTAAAHHSIAAGSIAVVDPTLADNGHHAVTRITPEVPFPEAEERNIREYYAAPWPLSEDYFLVAYSPKPLVWEPGANDRDALGIYLLDAFGNRELIYRDPDIGSTNPCPLVPRKAPPVASSTLASNDSSTGEMLLLDVYEGLGDVPRGTIKELRVIQIFPKTTVVANNPPVGIAREENARAVLGTVPIEPDGSARFTVPARKPILFQALDKDGFAYQTMRTITYAQPGERITCIGCHENRMTTPGPEPVMAARRPASRIEPGPFDGQPFSFVRVVQPVLDKHCVACHGGDQKDGDIDLTSEGHKGFTKSYWALCGDRDFWGAGTNPKNAAEALVPRFGGRNQVQITPPGGSYGARGSRLMKMLRDGHEEVKLSPDELRRLAMWIDCNAIFFGTTNRQEQERQLRGEIVAMPDIQ